MSLSIFNRADPYFVIETFGGAMDITLINGTTALVSVIAATFFKAGSVGMWVCLGLAAISGATALVAGTAVFVGTVAMVSVRFIAALDTHTCQSLIQRHVNLSNSCIRRYCG